MPIVKDSIEDMKAEVEFITDTSVSKEVVRKIVGKAIRINEIENFSLLFESIIKTKMGKQEIQIPSESIFTFHKLLTFVQRQNKEKFKKDLYYAYYMLRFCPKKEQLVNDVVTLIKERKEGQRVRQNLNEYFSDVDSKGPLFVQEENGPDAYIDDLKQDIFARFSKLRQ